MLCRVCQKDVVDADFWMPGRDARAKRAREELSPQTDAEIWLTGENCVPSPVVRREQAGVVDSEAAAEGDSAVEAP